MTKLPGMPARSPETIERRERIAAAIASLHRELNAITEALESNATITMRFKVAGDDLSVTLKPGKPNDA